MAWWVGGPSSVPLRARLFRRSCVAVRGASACVFFLASPSSPGSLAVAGFAVGRGLPVFAVSCAPGPVPFVPDPPRGCAGVWVASSFAGLSCWAWSPSQGSLFPAVVPLVGGTAARAPEERERAFSGPPGGASTREPVPGFAKPEKQERFCETPAPGAFVRTGASPYTRKNNSARVGAPPPRPPSAQSVSVDRSDPATARQKGSLPV